MNSQEELAEAFERYRAGRDGEAGRCSRFYLIRIAQNRLATLKIQGECHD
jgi:hypothetical protein